VSDSKTGLMTIFGEALEQPDATARATYLDQACGGDASLRRRVEALLAAHAGAGHFLEPEGHSQPSAHLLAEATAAFEPDKPIEADHVSAHENMAAPRRTIAGRYTLVEVIGEGGMGLVYRAEQTEPVKRQVALKLIKSGTDSRVVLARFDAERQALALMDHPNIARVYDGGTTEQGQPFFVMELVQGVPLTVYCDQKRLNVRSRLELFVQVCQAVQHAHQKGIIHRDLKPSNVLVTEVDGRPTPKVIDFGVAKATEVRLTDLSYADTGAIVGTPAYMSPEQADPSSMDIDTRTDVYALGVMLYELLVGSPPIDARQFKQGAVLEMLRMVREVDPPRPSIKLSGAGNLPNIAANRDIEPARLTKSLRGELDWVVMKALEKDRTRRYDTANAFARDLQRYLADEVVEARPPSAGYRLKKFVRRHKGQVIAAGLVLFTLVGGIVASSYFAFEARFQAKEANDNAKKADENAKEASKHAKNAGDRADDLKYQLGVGEMVLASAAYDNRDVVLAAERLEKVPEKQRGWEWRHLKQQTHGGLFTLYGHTSPVLGVAFSPDGERIVTAAEGANRKAEVKVWEARTGTAVFEVTDLSGFQRTNTIGGQWGWTWEYQVFGLGGTRLATVGLDHSVRLWDVRTGKPKSVLKHAGPVARVCLSSDGSQVATACLDGMVRLWDAATGKPQWSFKGTGERIRVWFSPDGTRVFAGPLANGTAKMLDARTGKPLLDLTGFEDNRGYGFSPDGKQIVTGNIRVAKVWDAEMGGPPLLQLKRISESSGRNASFSPDGTRILAGSSNGDTAQVWDAKTGTPLFTLKERRGPVVFGIWQFGWGEGEQGVAFSPDGTRIVTVGGQAGAHEATVWDARTGTQLLALTGHTNMVLCAAFSPDGTRIITGSVDGTAKVWDARTGTPQLEINGYRGELFVAAVSPDGTRIVAGGGEELKPGTATVWEARTGTAPLELKGLTGTVKSAAFSRDGKRIVTGGYQVEGDLINGVRGEAKVWDTRTGTALLELKGLKSGVNSVAISPDGTRILTAGGGPLAAGATNELKLWDAQTGAVLLDLSVPALPGAASLLDHRGASVAFSPDGKRFVAGGLRGKRVPASWATVRDTATGAALLELKGHMSTLLCVAYSPDGTRIVTGGGDEDRRGLVWDAKTGAVLHELKGHTSGVLCAAFSPDGARIVTGSGDRTVRVWDAKTGTSLLELKGRPNHVTSAAFSPDGTFLVTGEIGGTITVWDAPPRVFPPALRGHTGHITALSFSPDGTRIVAGSNDRTVKVWDTRTGAILLDLKGHKGTVSSVGFAPNGARIVSTDGMTVKAWDARKGAFLFGLKAKPGPMTVAFSRDGTRIVTTRVGEPAKVWDAGTGKELPGEAVPDLVPSKRISPDGRLLARIDASASPRVDLIPLKLDEKELAYRRLHSQPNPGRYQGCYESARAAKDDFAARFYLDRLIALYTATNKPDEVKKWRAERAKYPPVQTPSRRKSNPAS
jgi:WD40 repeat protein